MILSFLLWSRAEMMRILLFLIVNIVIMFCYCQEGRANIQKVYPICPNRRNHGIMEKIGNPHDISGNYEVEIIYGNV